MGNRARLLVRIVRWIPYGLLVALAIWYLTQLLQEFRPFEGSIPFLYEKIFDVFIFYLLVSSVFSWGAVRSVIVLTSCASIFSRILLELFQLQRTIAINAPPDWNGETSFIPWRFAALVGLLLLVMVIEAVALIRSRRDQPPRPAIPEQIANPS